MSAGDDRNAFGERGMEAHATGGLGFRFSSGRAGRLFDTASALWFKEFADLVEPAAAYAEEGFAVGQKFPHMWEWGASKLRMFDHSVQEYLPQGKPPKPGEIFRQPNLARTWRELGKHGRDYYYAGELARKIVAASDAGGGYLKLPDSGLSAFGMDGSCLRQLPRATESSKCLPTDKGSSLLMALRILEGYDIGGISGSDLAAAEHLILEALKLSFADAERYIGDPRFGQVDVEQLLSNDLLLRVAAKFEWIRRSHPAAGQLRGDTTYFTVVDKDRNAVSFITSISDVFGSGIVVG